MSLIWQEKVVKFLNENRKYQVLWWSFGSTMLEVLCKEKGFDAKELLEKKFTKSAQVEKQCVELLEAWGERKIYWWWPWSCKVKDAKVDEKQYQRAREYENYSWFWKIILGLFTSVLIHRRILGCNDLVVDYDKEVYMHKNTENSEFKARSPEQKKEEGCMHGHTTNSGFEEACSPEQKIDVIANLRKKHSIIKSITLEDALKTFELPSLQDLDSNLEMARKSKNSGEEHERYVNEKVYKRLKKLLVKYHPDKIQNKGGSEEDIAKATELFQVLKSTEATVEKLHKSVLEDVDFKYSFYSKMEVSLLGNVQKLEQLNFKILIRLFYLSDIRQEKLVPRINEFLKFSQSSMEKFIRDDLDNFMKERNKALACCSSYMDGYKSLIKALKLVKRDCGKDKDLSCIEPSIDEMLRESEAQLNVLEQVKKLSKDLMQGELQLSRVKNYRDIDKYFVLPFVEYINVLLMCSKVCAKEKELSQVGEESEGIIQEMKDGAKSIGRGIKDGVKSIGRGVKDVLWGKSESSEDSDIHEKDPQVTDLYSDIHEEDPQVTDLYKVSSYLMRWYCDGKTEHEEWIRNILGMGDDVISRERVKSEFINTIKEYKNHLAKEFKPEDYIGVSKLEELMNRCEELERGIQRVQDEQNKIRDDQEIIRTELRRIDADNKKRMADNEKRMADNEKRIAKVRRENAETDILIKEARAERLQIEALLQNNVEIVKEKQHAQNQGININKLTTDSNQPQQGNSNQTVQPTNKAGPSSKLYEVPPMSRSQSLNSLHSNGSDIEIISQSQCR